MKPLSQRSELILLLLKKFDYLTRDQLRRYFRLGSIRNTNRVLRELGEYLQSVRDGYETTYYLSKTGRAYVDCQKVRRKGNHIKHIVMRNEFWLFSGCPSDWKNETKINDGKVSVVCDGMFKKSFQYHFLEVDHLQSMAENRKKIKRYFELANRGGVTRKLGHFPKLVWLTTTAYRKKQLEIACKGLPCEVYSLEDIQ